MPLWGYLQAINEKQTSLSSFFAARNCILLHLGALNGASVLQSGVRGLIQVDYTIFIAAIVMVFNIQLPLHSWCYYLTAYLFDKVAS